MERERSRTGHPQRESRDSASDRLLFSLSCAAQKLLAENVLFGFSHSVQDFSFDVSSIQTLGGAAIVSPYSDGKKRRGAIVIRLRLQKTSLTVGDDK